MPNPTDEMPEAPPVLIDPRGRGEAPCPEWLAAVPDAEPAVPALPQSEEEESE